jgi:hypothetical protein
LRRAFLGRRLITRSSQASVADRSAEERVVPVRLIIDNDDNQAFGPEQINVLVTAFEDALKVLGLVDREDPATQMVAQRIIDLAKQGECDLVRLREGAVQTLSKRATTTA